MTASRRRDERGSGSILIAALSGVVVVLGCAAMLIAGYAAAHHRARAAADLAALSGAAAYGEGGDPCPPAARIARGNGASLESCEQVGDAVDYVVSVTAVVTVTHRVPGLPREVSASAHAGPLS